MAATGVGPAGSKSPEPAEEKRRAPLLLAGPGARRSASVAHWALVAPYCARFAEVLGWERFLAEEKGAEWAADGADEGLAWPMSRAWLLDRFHCMVGAYLGATQTEAMWRALAGTGALVSGSAIAVTAWGPPVAASACASPGELEPTGIEQWSKPGDLDLFVPEPETAGLATALSRELGHQVLGVQERPNHPGYTSVSALSVRDVILRALPPLPLQIIGIHPPGPITRAKRPRSEATTEPEPDVDGSRPPAELEDDGARSAKRARSVEGAAIGQGAPEVPDSIDRPRPAPRPPAGPDADRSGGLAPAAAAVWHWIRAKFDFSALASATDGQVMLVWDATALAGQLLEHRAISDDPLYGEPWRPAAAKAAAGVGFGPPCGAAALRRVCDLPEVWKDEAPKEEEEVEVAGRMFPQRGGVWTAPDIRSMNRYCRDAKYAARGCAVKDFVLYRHITLGDLRLSRAEFPADEAWIGSRLLERWAVALAPVGCRLLCPCGRQALSSFAQDARWTRCEARHTSASGYDCDMQRRRGHTSTPFFCAEHPLESNLLTGAPAPDPNFPRF